MIIAKKVLVNQKDEVILVLSNFTVFQCLDSNNGLFSIATSKFNFS